MLLEKAKRRRTVPKDVTIEFLLELLARQQGRCAVSGRELTFNRGRGRVGTNASIDRRNNNRGYERDNIQLLCSAVNMMKQDLTLGELLDWCEQIGTTARNRKGTVGSP